MVGVYLTVFSHWLGDYPEWVGPVVMLGLLVTIFIFPVPIYHRPRLWLVRICVSHISKSQPVPMEGSPLQFSVSILGSDFHCSVLACELC